MASGEIVNDVPAAGLQILALYIVFRFVWRV